MFKVGDVISCVFNKETFVILAVPDYNNSCYYVQNVTTNNKCYFTKVTTELGFTKIKEAHV